MMGLQESDQHLINTLVERGLIESSQAEALLEEQQVIYKQRKAQVQGLAYVIDPVKQELIVKSHPTGDEKHRLSLPGATPDSFIVDDYQVWGDRVLLAERNDGSRKAQFISSLTAPFGLVTAHDFTYLYNQGNLDTAYLALTYQALYSGMAKQAQQSGPYDLFVSMDKQWLCITNRGAGTLTLYALEPFKELATVQIREPGSSKTLNVALDEVNQRAYITDNQTATIFTLDFESMELSQNWTGLGNLGNLVLAPDRQHFYLLSLQPDAKLHYMSMNSHRASYEFKGQLFQDLGLSPGDLLTSSPEGEHLLMMTAHDEPEPETALFSVIRLPHLKTMKRYTLKGGSKPALLSYSFKNPLDFQLKSLDDLLIEAGLISADKLEEIKAEEEQSKLQKPKDEPIGLTIQTAGVVENKPESDTLSLTPKKSKRIDLSTETIADIVALLSQVFEQQTGVVLSEHAEAQSRVQEAAEKAREELEIFDSTIVQLDFLVDKHNLKTVLVREAIIRMQEARQSFDDDIEPPRHCPNCDERLDSWDCGSCGFELESPERIRKRRIASAEATANLPHGHLVIPDPEGVRLLQLNPYKYISWHLDPDKVPGDSPTDALWLPNNNILVADRDGNAVLELGLKGTVFWRFDTDLSPLHQLNTPVKVTYYVPENSGERHYLIVDQGNHRVIEVNAQGELLQSFGAQGMPGSDLKHLRHPSDIQYTHQQTYLIADTGNDRVLEFDREGQLVQTFGSEQDLMSPGCVQRLFNGHTLIVDAGNARLLELNEEGKILNECLYYSAAVDPSFQIVSPLKMIRLINQDILIMDEDKLIQLNIKTKKLVWFSKIENLAFQPKVDAPELVVDENGVEQLVYKVLDHGELKPVRLSQKINFKRMQKLIAARMQHEGAEEESAEDKRERKLQSLVAERMAESKRKLRNKMTTTSIQPSHIFEQPGSGLKRMHLYTVDKHHNAVIRLNRKGEVGWHYGFEMGQVLSRPYQVLETPQTLWVADSGQNRVIEIAKSNREIVRELKGPPMSLLGGPRALALLEQNHVLVADQRNKRLVELNPQNEIVWEYTETGKIRAPQSVEALGNGHFLYADSMLNMVREIDRSGHCSWYYGTRLKGDGPGQLFSPEYATRLANGHTLIADTRNNRVLEVNADGKEIWEYSKDPVSKRPILNPTHVLRLDNGNSVITFSNSRELIEVTPDKERVWYYKMGNDVFLPPVTGLSINLTQEVEELKPYYNPVEKRMIDSAAKRDAIALEAHITLMDNVQMKSVRASVIMMTLEHSGTVFKTFPSPEEILADKFGQQLIIAFTLDKDKRIEDAADALKHVAEVAETSVCKIELKREDADAKQTLNSLA